MSDELVSTAGGVGVMRRYARWCAVQSSIHILWGLEINLTFCSSFMMYKGRSTNSSQELRQDCCADFYFNTINEIMDFADFR